MGVVSNNWFDCVFTFNYLHVQTLVLTDVQTPFLGTFFVPLNVFPPRRGGEKDQDQGFWEWSTRLLQAPRRPEGHLYWICGTPGPGPSLFPFFQHWFSNNWISNCPFFQQLDFQGIRGLSNRRLGALFVSLLINFVWRRLRT